MTKKQKLELTWIGKENRPKLEPRILLEDPAKSYHAKHRVTDGDIFDNQLIFGDNLLALKALEAEFAGKVKCVFIDPPYNTGSAFTHYDDGVEHSIWLSLMRDRLEIIRRLLSEDGSLWITIDDNEAHYLKVLLDEVFGRANFVANVMWEKKFSPQNDANLHSRRRFQRLVYARRIRHWREAGYHVTLIFLSLPNPQMAIDRVAERVRQGGHDVPSDVIRRRFAVGLRNFESIYCDAVDAWAMYDNAGDEPVLTNWGEKP